MDGRLYTRRGCGLCAEAEEMLAALAPDIEIVDVDADPFLKERFGQRVPVLERAGRVLMEGRFDEPALLELLASRRPGG